MKNKIYYFLSGFPRSGNTLLSSILNQNPDICVYGNSVLSEIFADLEFKKLHNEIFLNFPDQYCLENISKNLFHNYYEHINSKYIIDRSCWTTKNNIEVLQKYCPNNIKIIFLYRDIIEILASFIKWSSENETFLDRFSSTREKCDYLMSENGPILRHYMSYENLHSYSDTISHICVSYDDIVLDTKNTIEKIYSFLDIQNYNHNLEEIESYSVNSVFYDDSILGNNLHQVRKVIQRNKYEITDYLDDEIIRFYSRLNNIVT